MAPYALPSIQHVERAAQLIEKKIIKTPVKTSPHLSQVAVSNVKAYGSSCGIDLFFKCENLQKTGSFKFRGASHFLATLEDEKLSNGVVAYSTGNHAQAVAHAAEVASKERGFHIPAHVVVPSNCPVKKIKSAESYGANVHLSGTSPEDRVRVAAKIQEATGAVLVPPADDMNIVLGQGTVLFELLEQISDMSQELDAVIVPSGGGGLLVGAITVCRPLGLMVFGAEPASGGPGLAKALKNARRSTTLEGPPSVADGLRSLTGEANWEHIKHPGNVEGVFTVTEDQIEEALRLAIENLGVLIEPSAAVPLAVALFNSQFARKMAELRGRARVGIVLTGGNIEATSLRSTVSVVRSIDCSSV